MNREDRPIPKMAEVSLPRWRSGSRPIRQSLERSGNFDRADQNNPIGSESKDTDPGVERRCSKSACCEFAVKPRWPGCAAALGALRHSAAKLLRSSQNSDARDGGRHL